MIPENIIEEFPRLCDGLASRLIDLTTALERFNYYTRGEGWKFTRRLRMGSKIYIEIEPSDKLKNVFRHSPDVIPRLTYTIGFPASWIDNPEDWWMEELLSQTLRQTDTAEIEEITERLKEEEILDLLKNMDKSRAKTWSKEAWTWLLTQDKDIRIQAISLSAWKNTGTLHAPDFEYHPGMRLEGIQHDPASEISLELVAASAKLLMDKMDGSVHQAELIAWRKLSRSWLDAHPGQEDFLSWLHVALPFPEAYKRHTYITDDFADRLIHIPAEEIISWMTEASVGVRNLVDIVPLDTIFTALEEIEKRAPTTINTELEWHSLLRDQKKEQIQSLTKDQKARLLQNPHKSVRLAAIAICSNPQSGSITP